MQFMPSLADMLFLDSAIPFCAHADAERIREQIDSVSEGNPKRVSFIVTDNAANMVAARRLVVETPGYR
jgi:hypothetical protein